MLSRFLLPSLLLLSSTSLASAQSNQGGPSQCISFDASWNLLAFNFNGKDYNAGTALDSTSPAQDITTSNRPPFDVTSSPPLCFLSKFTNSVYVLNADSSDKSSVYIYDATAKSWSKQATGGAVPPSFSNDAEGSFATILDHDTNVFYAMSGKKMLSLDMALLKAASGEQIPWNEVGEPTLSAEASSEGYVPTMALGQNHIHFLGVPGLNEGDAKVFVIHCAFPPPLETRESLTELCRAPLLQIRICSLKYSHTAPSPTRTAGPHPSSRTKVSRPSLPTSQTTDPPLTSSTSSYVPFAPSNAAITHCFSLGQLDNRHTWPIDKGP